MRRPLDTRRAHIVIPEQFVAEIDRRYDDPFGRGFEYVPFSKEDIYGPINELWS